MRWSTSDKLTQVAACYRNAVRDSQSPVQAVATRWEVTDGAAKQLIDRARRAGKLAPPAGHWHAETGADV